MITKILAVSATALLSLTALADDDDKDQRTTATFKAMDANRDDRLTQNEVSSDPTLAQHFTALDRDADGYLSKREYAAHAKGDMDKKKTDRDPY